MVELCMNNRSRLYSVCREAGEVLVSSTLAGSGSSG